jgi:twitching motility two-component system response regulator PilG
MIYHERVSVLLLDVAMPGIDGLELCRTVRSIPQFQNLPIIMLTARDGAFDKVQGRLAGATEYLTKPFDAQKLSQVVGQVLQPQ